MIKQGIENFEENIQGNLTEEKREEILKFLQEKRKEILKFLEEKKSSIDTNLLTQDDYINGIRTKLDILIKELNKEPKAKSTVSATKDGEPDANFGTAIEEDEEDEKNIKPTSTWTCKNKVEFKPFGEFDEYDNQIKVELTPGQTVKEFKKQFIVFTIDDKNEVYRLPLIDFQKLVSKGLELEEEVRGFKDIDGGSRRKTRKRKFNKKKSKRNRKTKTKNRNKKTKNRNRKNKNRKYSKKRN